MPTCPKCHFKWEKYARSIKQNKLYWKILSLISEETGQDSESLHEYFKLKYNSEVLHIGKDEVRIGKSTASLSVPEFIKYIDNIIRFASMNLNIIIPTQEQS